MAPNCHSEFLELIVEELWVEIDFWVAYILLKFALSCIVVFVALLSWAPTLKPEKWLDGVYSPAWQVKPPGGQPQSIMVLDLVVK